MKQQNYSSITDKSIMEVKMYVLQLVSGKLEQDIHDIINSSIDTTKLQKRIMKRKDIALYIFICIKKQIDAAKSFIEIEEHLIYLNILLDSCFKPVMNYKYNLFQYILITVETYCILRHLIKWNKKQLPDFLEYMKNSIGIIEEQFHLLATTIYCIEQNYKLAYVHLTYIEFDYSLEKYRHSLQWYSPYKYYKIIEHRNKGSLLPLFNK